MSRIRVDALNLVLTSNYYSSPADYGCLPAGAGCP